MIKKEKVNGKECTVAYFNSKWKPCDKKVATNIKIRYPDGKIVFAGVPK
jgi:hypothetical protein